ncbi:DinB family protein [Alicyclobacillus sp.]|uniref:DinB family protein n=1 Tax=Alicyclobacillus sp. TaxID=61169 RepID=UPI0025C0C546|nr:DinB family protein [Alicyclobacillus sp.]MCL6517348.1 DinB family protein [Alicyclobacillus sp.]
MIPEVADLFSLWKMVHASVDKMIADLTDEQLTKKPEGNNSIAAVLEHTALVERKFLSALAGEVQNIDTQAPFKASSWDVAKIKADWNDVVSYGESVLSKLTAEQLSEFGLKLGVGEVNKRQLLVYMISHTTHHRGQIPILKRLVTA